MQAWRREPAESQQRVSRPGEGCWETLQLQGSDYRYRMWGCQQRTSVSRLSLSKIEFKGALTQRGSVVWSEKRQLEEPKKLESKWIQNESVYGCRGETLCSVILISNSEFVNAVWNTRQNLFTCTWSKRKWRGLENVLIIQFSWGRQAHNRSNIQTNAQRQSEKCCHRNMTSENMYHWHTAGVLHHEQTQGATQLKKLNQYHLHTPETQPQSDLCPTSSEKKGMAPSQVWCTAVRWSQWLNMMNEKSSGRRRGKCCSKSMCSILFSLTWNIEAGLCTKPSTQIGSDRTNE